MALEYYEKTKYFLPLILTYDQKMNLFQFLLHECVFYYIHWNIINHNAILPSPAWEIINVKKKINKRGSDMGTNRSIVRIQEKMAYGCNKFPNFRHWNEMNKECKIWGERRKMKDAFLWLKELK